MSQMLLVGRNLCNPPSICDIRVLVSPFVIRASFVILVSSFVISRRAGVARCLEACGLWLLPVARCLLPVAVFLALLPEAL
jgi:hypothetical protein